MRRPVVPVVIAMLALAFVSARAEPIAARLPTFGESPLPLAEAPTALTLASAWQQALNGNPDLAAARSEIAASEGARIQAGAFPNPTLDVGLEDQRTKTRTTTVLLSQPIELGGKRAARIESAERGIDVARTQLDAKRLDIQANVTAAFFAALVAQERVSLAKASLDIARRGAEVAGKRVAAGKVSPVEETKAKVAQSSAGLELAQAQGDLRTSLAQLRAAIGSGPAIERVDGNAVQTPRLPSPAEVAARLDDAPAVREARLEVRRLEALSDLERAKRIPDLTVTVGATRPNEIARNQAVLGVSIPLPIFDTNRGNIQEAMRRQDKAEDLAKATELRVRTEASVALQRMETALSLVGTLQDEILPGAQLALDAATKGFELGKFNYLDALDAQRTLLEARSQYLNALAEAHKSSADLQRLLGPVGLSAAQSIPASQSLQ
ncbi:TolC family protein [Variovorax dokdonensis]|uniref:TolC family protein n=1 Tax=Variovorax dokdonensis TaxID=344883 RepID=A0ABT7NGE4_9BURK|nr:TolC family protein [Variovorax dokdonensis]MDM0047019.1 TolC family protein [Variovorax dokdonensis]